MTLQQIYYALTISQTGSLNKAAEILYVAQPSLTGAMQELEKELGITIFHRSGRGVSLTNDGLEFINTCLVHHTWQQRYVWFPEVMRPVEQGIIKIKPLINAEFKLEDIKEGFDFVDKDDAAIKVVFRP